MQITHLHDNLDFEHDVEKIIEKFYWSYDADIHGYNGHKYDDRAAFKMACREIINNVLKQLKEIK